MHKPEFPVKIIKVINVFEPKNQEVLPWEYQERAERSDTKAFAAGRS